MQVVCDYKGTFMDVKCLFPGSVYNRKVLVNSSINKKFQNSGQSNIFHSLKLEYEKASNCLIRDPAYCLTPFYIKKFDLY